MADDFLPLFQPTPLQRRIIDAAVEIGDCTPDSAEFLHSVLCQAGLPRSATKERVFERNSGRASIRVETGALYKGGKWIEQQLPYGAKPRLALIHVSSEAVRTRSRTVEVGESIAEFLRLLDLPTNGPAYREMKRQIERLAACNMTLGMSAPGRDVTVSAKPIERFEAWLQYDGRQRSIWPGVLELSQPFFETLVAHAVPLDPRAIHALKKSALALDVYSWLAHRLCRVRKQDGVKLSWANLRLQFGQEYGCSKDFKKEFRAALFKVRAVYPSARLDDEIGGIRLYSSPAPIPKSQSVVRLPG